MNVLRSLVYVPLFLGTVGLLGPSWVLPGFARRALEAGGPTRWLGWAAVACGVALCLWCVFEFTTAGRGTPAPFDPPRRMVARGPYRFVRNPMYLGMLLVLAGEAILARSVELIVYAAAIALVFHLFVILVEEPSLARSFGEDYERYRREVRRWLPRRAPIPPRVAAPLA